MYVLQTGKLRNSDAVTFVLSWTLMNLPGEEQGEGIPNQKKTLLWEKYLKLEILI
jgi:hypothetical protein